MTSRATRVGLTVGGAGKAQVRARKGSVRNRGGARGLLAEEADNRKYRSGCVLGGL